MLLPCIHSAMHTHIPMHGHMCAGGWSIEAEEVIATPIFERQEGDQNIKKSNWLK